MKKLFFLLLKLQKITVFIDMSINLLLSVHTQMLLEFGRQFEVIIATTAIPNKKKIVVIILRPSIMSTKMSYLTLYSLHLLVGTV